MLRWKHRRHVTFYLVHDFTQRSVLARRAQRAREVPRHDPAVVRASGSLVRELVGSRAGDQGVGQLVSTVVPLAQSVVFGCSTVHLTHSALVALRKSIGGASRSRARVTGV